MKCMYGIIENCVYSCTKKTQHITLSSILGLMEVVCDKSDEKE